MRFVTAFALVIGILFVIFTFGCTSSDMPVPPFTVCQLISKGVDVNGNPLSCANFYAGDYNSLCIGVLDGNHLGVKSCGSGTGSTDWNHITGFPAPCPANNYVQIIGTTLTCVALPAGTIDTNNVTANWQDSSGNWKIDINLASHNIRDVNSLYGHYIWTDANREYGILLCPDGNIFVNYVAGKVC